MFYESEEFIEGKVTISDNVEDEWYIISLLFRISENLENVVIQVNDQDGEVLLIEAADFLPKWAQDPESAENRVFIHKGCVHLIPIAKTPAELTPLSSLYNPNIEDAVRTVFRYSHITKASDLVQNSIRSRMKSYPKDWSNLTHFTHILVPQNMKFVLENCPKNLISKAIRLFYYRDHIDLKVCRILKKINSKSETLTLVKVGLKLTKCIYAMLNKQKFNPDKKSGWPAMDQSHSDFKAWNLGAKLCFGFEILANSKVHQDEMRQAYIQSLTNKGYFQSELRGSKKYQNLLDQAQKHFLQMAQSYDINIKSPAIQLKELLQKEKEHENEETSETGSELEPEDDDSWMDLKPESFDEMLKAHFKLKNEVDQTSNNKSKQDIPNEVKKFLKTMSDFEGIEEQNPTSKSKKCENEEIDFNADEFENAFKKVLGISSDNDQDKSE